MGFNGGMDNEPQMTSAEVDAWLDALAADLGERMTGPDDERPHPDAR